MTDTGLDREGFLKAAAAFRQRLDLESTLCRRVAQALAVIGEAAVKLVAICRDTADEKGPLITAKISESVVQISSGDRNLALAAAHGAAMDTRLASPRGQLCGQLLLFCHLSGQQESSLVSTFRVYANGECTSGDVTFNIEGGAAAVLPDLARIVRSMIFEAETYWPGPADLPDFLQKIPILEQELHEEALKRPCVGFECNLQR